MTKLTRNSEFEHKTLQEFAQHAIDKLTDGVGANQYGADLHNDLFNADYYIIGTYDAEQWLIANTGVFKGIGIVQEYETDQFGEVNTDLSKSENVVNMLAYIGGEEILGTSKTLQKKWDARLDDKDIKAIIRELKKEFDLK